MCAVLAGFRMMAIGLLLTAMVAVVTVGDMAHGQIRKGFGRPSDNPFGFEPGKKMILEGVYRVDNSPKGNGTTLDKLVDSFEKSVVIYTRQQDDSIFKVLTTLDSKGDGLKDSPIHGVFLFAERAKLEEKARTLKHVSILESHRTATEDWQRLKLDQKLTTMVFLLQKGTIQKRIDIEEGTLKDERITEITKEILAYVTPATAPVKPTEPLIQLPGHPGGARSMVFSPDGKWLYSHGTQKDNGLDARIIKWDLATKKEVANVESHGASASCLQVTSDGKTLVSGGHEAVAKFWDAETMKLLETVKLPDSPFSMNISPNDQSLAIGFRDKNIRIYDMKTKKELFLMKGHKDRVRAVAFSPDSKLLVSGDEYGVLKLWNAVEGKEVATWDGHTNSVYCVQFSADGKRVVSGGREMRGVSGPGRARIWNVETGKEVRELESTRVNGVLAIALLDKDQKLAIAGESNIIRIIDLVTGKEVGEYPGHRSAILSLALSADGSTLASGDWWGPIRLWNVKPKK